MSCSHLNRALVCKRKNVAISQDLAVKAHVVSAFNFSVNQRGKNQIGIVSAVDLFFGAVTFWVTESNFFAETLLCEFVGTKADLLAARTFSLVW
ncbi:TPA: hypothetical protein NGT29_004561 [Vibrio parahaemolyticus]|nr:hypothetical protein [Vibrio parahaemolyticus]